MSTFRKLAILAIVAALLPCCKKKDEEASAQSIGDKMKKTTEEIQDYSAEKAKEFSSMFSKKMDTLGDKIEDLRAKAANETGDAKAAMEKQLTTLEKKKKDLGTKLEELGKKTGEAWTKLSAEIGKGYDELEKSISKLIDDQG